MPLSDQQIEGRAACLVTASEVADLMGVGRRSPFVLYHEKAGNLEPDPAESEATAWGNVLEAPIARTVAQQRGWKIRKVERHLTVGWNDLGLLEAVSEAELSRALRGDRAPNPLGASLDYEVALGSWAPMEVKAVGRYASRAWEGGQPPLPVLLQVQAQLACARAPLGIVAGLRSVTGPADVAEVPRHEPTIRLIFRAVLDLEISLARGEAPAPDYSRQGDVEAVLALHKAVTPGKVIDRRGDPAVERILADYKSASAEKGKLEKETKGLWAELLTTLGPDADFEELIVNEHYAKTWPLPEMDIHRKAGRGHNVWERKS